MSDPHAALLRSIARDYDRADGPDVGETGCRPWASATFTGARHWLMLGFDGDDPARDARQFAGWMEEHEFCLPGHLVADIRADPPQPAGDRMTMRLEVLTIETC